MTQSLPSLNMVILSGVVDGSPHKVKGVDGATVLELTVLTSVFDRAIKHTVRVSDASIIESVADGISDGTGVHISGHLDYDAKGSFVSVSAHGARDMRITSAHPVQPKTQVQAPRQIERPAQDSAPVSEIPVDDNAETEAKSQPAQASSGFPRTSFGMNRPSTSAAPKADEEEKKPASKFSAFSKFKSTGPDNQAEDESPDSSDSASESSTVIQSSFRKNFSGPKPAGGDKIDDDIPF